MRLLAKSCPTTALNSILAMMFSNRFRRGVLVAACSMTVLGIALAATGCGPSRQQQDSDLAGKYRDAPRSIENVGSVDTDYRTFRGMGATANITINATTGDRPVMLGIMREALPAITRIKNDQDQASIVIRVVAPGGYSLVVPDALGFEGDGTGGGTLAAFRTFVEEQGL